MLRATCYVLRATCYVLRATCNEKVTSYKESFRDIVKKKKKREDAVQKTVIKISSKRIEYSNVRMFKMSFKIQLRL